MAKHFADSNEILESQPKHLSDEETLSHNDETASSHQETHQELGIDSDEKVSESESNTASDTDASHIEDAKSTTTAIQSVERYKIDTSVLPRIDANTFAASDTDGDSATATATSPDDGATVYMPPLETSENKEPRKKRKLWLIPIVFLAILTVIYFGGVLLFHFIFLPHTTIYGTDYSLKPTSALSASIESDASNYTGHISGNGVDLDLKASDINLTYDGKGYAESAKSQENIWAWPVEIFKSRDLKPVGTASYDHDKLKAYVDEIIQKGTAAAGEQDHNGITFDSASGKFTMSEQARAMRLSPDAVDQEVGQAFNSLQKDIKLDDSVVLSAKEIDTAIETANTYVSAAPKLKLGNNDAGAITADQVASWISFDENLNVTLNEQAIKDYAHGDLSKQLDSKGTARTYTRPDGKEITTAAAGHYGWSIDGDATADAIINAIKSGSAQPTVDVPCLQSAVTYDPGKQDWGKRYIDVDLSEQHARLYDDNGSIIWEADVVTGIPDGRHNTPEGVWDITSHIRGARLLGPNDESGRPGWDTKVDFWLGVKGQEAGFHNAPWRSAFGGQIYKTGGSHGCINLSYDDAQKLFDIAKDGDPVVIHY